MPRKSKVNKRLIKKQVRFERGVIFFLGIAAFFVGVKLLYPSFASSPSWHQVPKTGIPSGIYALDIGTGGAGEFIVGSNGYVYKLNGSSWINYGNAHATNIAVGSSSIWVVQTNGDLAYRSGSSWTSTGANRNGAIYDVGFNGNSMYFTRASGIYRADGSRVYGTPSSRAPSTSGGLAVFPGIIMWDNQSSQLWYYNTNNHDVYPSNSTSARDIGAYNNSQWVVTRSYQVWQSSFSGWHQDPYHVTATKIAVDQHRNPWIITGAHNIYHWY